MVLERDGLSSLNDAKLGEYSGDGFAEISKTYATQEFIRQTVQAGKCQAAVVLLAA